ncbi:MAG: hypothetical protein ACRC7R_11425, partial [Sarcina sp.]
MRSVSAIWLVAYLLNGTNFHVDTSKFTLDINRFILSSNMLTLDKLMPLETKFTGKYDYEVKNNKDCSINYESFKEIDKNTYEVKFDNGISLKNTYGLETIDYDFNNDLTISTNSDSAHIGIFKQYSNKPVNISNILKKVINKEDYSVYYINTTYKSVRGNFLSTLAVVVFKNGKIKVLDEKEFTENVATEKNRDLKMIKIAIMKNEIINFFDSNMFLAAFKGLNKLDYEKEKLNAIITDYINEEESPINVKDYRLDELNEEIDNCYEYNEDTTLEDRFDSSLNEVIFLQGNKIDIANGSYFLSNKKPQDIMEIYKEEKAVKKGSSYYFKDMVFSYDKTNPSQLMEVIVKSP